ncbi:cytochrome b561 [Rhodoligotrophos appendicifer]|uniref:cytochrome b n=1 Tax=Rhodoligotrophos appendicifer TaxID=987056 RepID=UPI001186FE0F|nr:cytochrome b [Rhodoligotrophos appendicifer]
MAPRNARTPATLQPQRYTGVAQALHWLTVILIAAILPIAWLAETATGALQNEYFTIHMSLGVTIFAVIVLRLIWRATHPAPPLPGHAGAALEVSAKISPWLLYLILLIMPITGYLMASSGSPVPFFGLFELPALPKNESLAEWAEKLHLLGQWAVYGLIALHIGATAFHLIMRRDALLDRMLPPQTGPHA